MASLKKTKKKQHQTYLSSIESSDFPNWEAPEEETTASCSLRRAGPSCEAARGQALTNETEAVKAERSREVSGDSFHLSVRAAAKTIEWTLSSALAVATAASLAGRCFGVADLVELDQIQRIKDLP